MRPSREGAALQANWRIILWDVAFSGASQVREMRWCQEEAALFNLPDAHMSLPSAAMRRLCRDLEAGRPEGGGHRRADWRGLQEAAHFHSRRASPLRSRCRVVLRCTESPAAVKSSVPSSRDHRREQPLIIHLSTGAQVRVRTPVGKLCTGQVLMLWLRAVVDRLRRGRRQLRTSHLRTQEFKVVRVRRRACRRKRRQAAAQATRR